MPGPRRAIVLSLGTLLACGCGAATAAEPAKRPLQLKLSGAPTSSAALAASPGRARVGAPARPARFRIAEPSLRQRAVEALLDDADDQAARLDAPAADGSFRFKRRGDAGRELAQGYNAMCDAVSRKVWDDPKGRRVSFDVAGKPGVGIEIPLR